MKKWLIAIATLNCYADNLVSDFQERLKQETLFNPASFIWENYADRKSLDVDDFNDECIRLRGTTSLINTSATKQIFKDGYLHICDAPVIFTVTSVKKSNRISYDYLVSGVASLSDSNANIKKAKMSPNIFKNPSGGVANTIINNGGTFKSTLKIKLLNPNNIKSSPLEIIL